jgi:hypothetical protein
LEDCSSVEEIVVHSSLETEGSKPFCVVEMMYFLWKWPSKPSIGGPRVTRLLIQELDERLGLSKVISKSVADARLQWRELPRWVYTGCRF